MGHIPFNPAGMSAAPPRAISRYPPLRRRDLASPPMVDFMRVADRSGRYSPTPAAG